MTFLSYEFPPTPGPSHAVADGSGKFPSASEGEDRWEPLRSGLWVIRSQRDALQVGESPDIKKPSPCLGPWGESPI